MIADPIADKKTVSEVVSKALIRAADDLGLNGCQLSQATGMSEASISRVKRGTYFIGPDTKNYELAMMIIRVHKALATILGGDKDSMRSWMANQNLELKAIPSRKIAEIRGLVSVLIYLELRVKNTV